LLYGAFQQFPTPLICYINWRERMFRDVSPLVGRVVTGDIMCPYHSSRASNYPHGSFNY